MALAIGFAISSDSCTGDSSNVLAEAYVAPASVNLRSQLNQKNSTVATLHHGEKVKVTDVRRRYVRVRTAKGAEGWMDSQELLSVADMAAIQAQRKRDLALPSEGAATPFETLNIHLSPNRKAAAFAQIPEGDFVSVLAFKLVPKTALDSEQTPTFTIEKPKPLGRKPKKEKPGKSSFKLPKAPEPPKPPRNWVQMSGGEAPSTAAVAKTDGATKKSEEDLNESPRPPVLEAWALVRTASKQTGWVLSRNLMMAIPDEVAQYAEGKRITSYFDLGAVNDEEKGQKHNWLWTTMSKAADSDFDAWRVFLWNRRRHRYETSYRQHELEGFFPVVVDPPNETSFGRTFKLITRDEDGNFRRRSYIFDGTLVHLTGTEDYHRANNAEPQAGRFSAENLAAKSPAQSWWRRRWAQIKERIAGSGT